MLDPTMQQQLSTYLANLREGIELVASLGDDAKSAQTRELLEEIAALHPLVTARFDGADARRPSFAIVRSSDPSRQVRFAGLPMGHEFTSLVLALLWAGGHPPKVSDEVLASIAAIEGTHDFEMYFSLTCHNCPDVVQALTLLALFNPNITATLIEGGTFKDEVEERGVMAVPATFKDGAMFASGKMSVEELVAKLDSGAAKRTIVGGDSGGCTRWAGQAFRLGCHFELSIIIGTRAISGSAAIRFRNLVMAYTPSNIPSSILMSMI